MDAQSPETLTVERTEAPAPGTVSPADTTFGQLIATEPRHLRPSHRIDGTVVWLIASLAFIGYLAFGSVTVQVWRFSDFLQQYYPIYVSRRILHIWIYQGNQLPDVRYEWLLHAVYYTVLFVCLAGAIYGVWLLLDRAGTGASGKRPTRRPPTIDG